MPLSARSARSAVLPALVALAVGVVFVACGSSTEPAPFDITVVALSPTASASPGASERPASATPAGAPVTTPFDLPILMYHHVSSVPPLDQLGFNLTVTTGDFTRQLDYLKCAGYSTVTLAQLFDYLRGGAPLPPKPIILTFDDGYADGFTDAFPLLSDGGFKGSFAIVTGFVGGGDLYMSWDQIEAMAAAGMEIVSHTVSHIDLNTSDDATDRQQIADSKRALEEHLRPPVDFFVYPSGEPFRSGTAERQQSVVAMLREAGYEGALLAGPSSTTQDPGRPYELNRVRVSGGNDLYTFAGSIGGPSPDAVAAPCP